MHGLVAVVEVGQFDPYGSSDEAVFGFALLESGLLFGVRQRLGFRCRRLLGLWGWCWGCLLAFGVRSFSHGFSPSVSGNLW